VAHSLPALLRMNSLRNSKSLDQPATLRAFIYWRRIIRAVQGILLLAVMGIAFFGCGYAGSPPVKEVVVIISPVSASIALGQTQQFVASVTGSTSSGVNWSVNSVTGGNSSIGSISTAGLYTAPAALPNPTTVTITAASASSPQSSASATITITDGLQVGVTPISASLPVGGTQVFTATVFGAGGLPTTVTWSVNGISGGNPAVGMIVANSNNSAVYTAPTTIPNPPTVTISATSTADTSKSGSATVTLTSGLQVTVAPTTASVPAGGAQAFAATVSGAGTLPTTVNWSVNGITGGNSTIGTIVGSSGNSAIYTAPATIPNPSTVTVTASSTADSSKSGSATVTLTSGLQVSIAPTAASVPAGGAQTFTATVSGAGTLPTTVTWSVNGITGGNSTIGTIAANSSNSAVYTAPATIPNPPTVTIAATSAAATSKSGSAVVTIVCAGNNSISPATASVTLGQSQPFTASLCISAGATISWDVNGIAGGNATFGTITVTGAATATFTAPQNLPSPSIFQIHAVSGSASATATITLSSGISVALSPLSATLNFNQRQTFTPTVSNSTNSGLSWTVNGVPNGSTAVGQVCVQNSSPCQPPAIPFSGDVDYLGPSSLPVTNPVTLTATSAADATRSASATITIAGTSANVTISISPVYAFVPPSTSSGSTSQFFASVTGSSNANVTWTVQSAVAGQGCSASACGSISSTGLFTAPTAAPSPNAIAITATSVADSTQLASATVAITSGPVIEVELPSSVFSGAVESFPLAVQGLNFIPGNGATASTILINGVARGTTCATSTGCATALNLSDVQSPGTLTIQIRNPAPLSALSNPVPFVILPLDISVAAISLTSAAPSAAPFNLLVPEPTTAAASAPLNVDSIGLVTAGNCEIAGSPVTVTRPASGTVTASLCIAGNGLDPKFLYAFSGADGIVSNDIPVTATAITGLFPNLVELDLQISSTTLPGVRTLLITTLNNDRAAATGMLEVK
jgi:hypothetical protein